MILLDDFLIRAVCCGLLLSLITGPLGCFLVWRRLAFFGDALSHSSLLGIGLGLSLGIDIRISVLLFTLLLALILGFSSHRTPSDARLVLISHGALASGLITLSFFPQLQGDLNGFLFGDLLALSTNDVYQIAVCTFLSAIIVIFYWRPFLNLTLSEEMAFVEGQRIRQIKIIFYSFIGLFIAVTSKVVGVILLTALFIIPAISARLLARSPVQMALIASSICLMAFIFGFTLSYQFDLPLTAAIVMAGVIIYIISKIYNSMLKGR